MAICKSCKAELNKGATKCSHCGTDQRNWFRKHPIITGLVIFFPILITIGASGGDKGKNTESPAVTAQAETKPSSPSSSSTPSPKIVSAEKIELGKLMKNFDDNKLAAEDKYKGKLIQVTGKISNISEDIMGSPYISLANPANAYSATQLKCNFNDKNVLKSLKNDTSVTVSGTVDGQDLGIISLNDCSIVQ